MSNPSSTPSNLSPARLTFSGLDIRVTTMIRQKEQWKKFSLLCRSAEELWEAIHLIHEKGQQALAEASLCKEASQASEASLELDYAEFIERWLAAGNQVKKLPSGKSSFKTSKIDVEALCRELDKIDEDAWTDEDEATNEADDREAA